MASHIIDHIASDTTSPVLFFYFRHGHEAKTSMAGMLRALLVQLLYRDDSLAEFFHRECSPLSPSQLCSLSKLQDLAVKALKSQNSCYLVLDGLDECGENSRASKQTSESIINWLNGELIPACHTEKSKLRILISGQRDGVLDQKLADVPAISLDSLDSHRKDIQRFVEQRLTAIRQRFSISNEAASSIVSRVISSCDGKFCDLLLLTISTADVSSKACFSTRELWSKISLNKALRRISKTS